MGLLHWLVDHLHDFSEWAHGRLGYTWESDYVSELRELADELIDPMICREPAFGAPGHAHCAACCGGTGLVVTCEEEQATVDAVKAMRHLADLIEAAP
jgi:hypothetical protein